MNRTTLHGLNTSPARQSGFSLIELMIASVIGLILLAGTVTIFSSNNASATMSTGMARLQDSGRVALDIISNSIRMAGYQGCRNDSKNPIEVLANNAPTIGFPDNALWGSAVDNAEAWDPAVHADLVNLTTRADGVKPDTDVLYVQHGGGRSINLAVDMVNGGSDIVLPSNPDQLQAGDLIMIADCETTNIFRATGTQTVAATGQTTILHAASLNSQSNLTATYTGTGNPENVALRVMRLESKAYFISDSTRDAPDGEPIFSLFELDTAANVVGNGTELIEGVEFMQVLYGENRQPDGVPDIRYVSADNVIDMANVVSVQIGLLIATADFAAPSEDNNIYNIAGTTVGPPGNASTDLNHEGDRRMRAAFNTTIQLRNRVL